MIDLTARPRRRGRQVVNTWGLLTLGNEIAVASRMDYPLYRQRRGRPQHLAAEAPWGQFRGRLVAGAWLVDLALAPITLTTHCRYPTLAAPFLRAGRVARPLVHHGMTLPGTPARGSVVSNGTDWISLASFTGTSSNQWRRARFSLAPYSNAVSQVVAPRSPRIQPPKVMAGTRRHLGGGQFAVVTCRCLTRSRRTIRVFGGPLPGYVLHYVSAHDAGVGSTPDAGGNHPRSTRFCVHRRWLPDTPFITTGSMR